MKTPNTSVTPTQTAESFGNKVATAANAGPATQRGQAMPSDLLEVCLWFTEACESGALIPRSNDRSEINWFNKRLNAARETIALFTGKQNTNPHFDPRLHKLHNEIGSKPEHWE